MKALLRKEFYLLGGRKPIVILLLITAVFALLPLYVFMGYSFLLVILLLTIPSILHNKSFACRWNQYADTLPLTRAQLIDARYLTVYFLILGGTLIILLLSLLNGLLYEPEFTARFRPAILIFGAGICIYAALALPFSCISERLNNRIPAIIGSVILTVVFMVVVPRLLIFLIDDMPDPAHRFSALYVWLLLTAAISTVSWLITRCICAYKSQKRR